jgi:hypothetical protein
MKQEGGISYETPAVARQFPAGAKLRFLICTTLVSNGTLRR